jgi:hypothetical protein
MKTRGSAFDGIVEFCHALAPNYDANLIKRLGKPEISQEQIERLTRKLFREVASQDLRPKHIFLDSFNIWHFAGLPQYTSDEIIRFILDDIVIKNKGNFDENHITLFRNYLTKTASPDPKAVLDIISVIVKEELFAKEGAIIYRFFLLRDISEGNPVPLTPDIITEILKGVLYTDNSNTISQTRGMVARLISRPLCPKEAKTLYALREMSRAK